MEPFRKVHLWPLIRGEERIAQRSPALNNTGVVVGVVDGGSGDVEGAVDPGHGPPVVLVEGRQRAIAVTEGS